MTTFAVASVNSLLCQASTSFPDGLEGALYSIHAHPMQSMSENDFECGKHWSEIADEGHVRPFQDCQGHSSAARQSLRSTGFITWNSMNSNEIEQALCCCQPKMAGFGDDVKVDKILPTY